MKEEKTIKLKKFNTKKQKERIPTPINQHFLFNTLNSLLSLCRQNPEEARRVVLELSNYLRFNLNNTDELVFLQEEIQYIKSYLYIQKIRFGDRLNIEYNIQEEVDILIPRNSLYNIIENAITHGILKKNQGGTITIIIKKSTEKIIIQIQDNGIGMEPQQITKILGKNRNCSALEIVNSQYKKLYKVELDILSKLQKGTCISLCIPMENLKYE